MKTKLAWLLMVVPALAANDFQRPGENIALNRHYTLEPQPNYIHCTDPGDAVQLTDVKYTHGYFWTQKSTVGWQNKDLITITLDLGLIQPICGLSFNTAAGVAGVEWPQDISLLISDDGTHFHFSGDLVKLSAQYGNPPAKGYGVHRYWTDALRTHGRYLKLLV